MGSFAFALQIKLMQANCIHKYTIQMALLYVQD